MHHEAFRLEKTLTMTLKSEKNKNLKKNFIESLKCRLKYQAIIQCMFK